MQTPSSAQAANPTASPAVAPPVEPDYSEFRPKPAYTPEPLVEAPAPDANAKTTQAAPAADLTDATAQTALSEVEKIAMDMGWTPRDQWNGNPNNWAPAADYLRRTAELAQARKKDVTVAKKAVVEATQDFERRLAAMERTNTVLMERQKRDFEAREASIRAHYEKAKREAVAQGDIELYDQIESEQKERDDALAKAEEQRRQEANAQPVTVYDQAKLILSRPAESKFLSDNRWILKHEDDSAWNLAMGEMADAAQKGLPIAEQMKRAEDALRYAYPDKYRTANPSTDGQGDGNAPAVIVDDQGRARDAQTGQFVRTAEAPSPQAAEQQPARRPAQLSPATRVPVEVADSNFGLPPEALAKAQSLVAKGEFESIKEYADIYNGVKKNVLA